MRTAVVSALLLAPATLLAPHAPASSYAPAAPVSSYALAAPTSPYAAHPHAAHPHATRPYALAAPDDPPPALSVSLTDDTRRAAAGDRLAYIVTVRNEGGRPVRRLRVEQQMPETTTSAEAFGGAVVTSGKAVWITDLTAYGDQVFTSSAVLGPHPGPGTAAPGTLRAASTVCVYPEGKRTPAVCDSDLDDRSDLSAASPTGASATPWLGVRGRWALGAAGVAALAGGGALLVRRRRNAAKGADCPAP